MVVRDRRKGTAMVIDVYADVVCPWCYIGERRLERAIARHPDLQVERRWRPFQLQPGMPTAGLPWSDFARRKFGGVERARSAFAQVTRLGPVKGLPLHSIAWRRPPTPSTRTA